MHRTTPFSASGHSLARINLFDSVNDEIVTALLASCEVAHFDCGEAVEIPQGRQACVYIVLRGALGSTTLDDSGGPRQIRTEKILPGESIGELSVLDETATLGSLTALEDSDLLILESQTLWQLIDEAEGVARNLLRQLSFKLRTVNAQLRRREKVGEFYRQLSMVDSLTGLHNRAWLNDRLPVLIEEAHTGQKSLSLIMIDLDHFKKFNDNHGHQTGDKALRAAAGVITSALRPSDFAVRYGGEELIVILPESSLDAGKMVAQRLCERMREADVFNDASITLPHLTASFGVTTLLPGQNADALISGADAALYRAKNAGRNQIAF
ncbi:MAG: GGDEF domain-containing protein [Oxalicibacterium faecigallinarum]|uniref:diguanylate cyclase n=1 Tax=Oxalicibacterium faecigallinarum TaxID=573741 RepID=A0A8J3F692_9BURK|nr:GGDEF domain-containing protein [Oxalicibacterium faecigallinarum]MDQ7970366.1 GGDEF domain-containing protein [Oxalicibacterium faecigallinarum]GGI18754.1 hypothetical protein GCM10008066_15660 [Oxalicibacterium faecigallinarum]